MQLRRRALSLPDEFPCLGYIIGIYRRARLISIRDIFKQLRIDMPCLGAVVSIDLQPVAFVLFIEVDVLRIGRQRLEDRLGLACRKILFGLLQCFAGLGILECRFHDKEKHQSYDCKGVPHNIHRHRSRYDYTCDSCSEKHCRNGYVFCRTYSAESVFHNFVFYYLIDFQLFK